MFSFSSYPFSVTMERIEKCANYSIYSEEITFPYISDIYEELRESKPDWEKIRKALTGFSKLTLYVFGGDTSFDLVSYLEHIYSKICLRLLDRPDMPLEDELIALPFMNIDFFRIAAERFSAGDLNALRQTEISFDAAVKFICDLDMPDSLKVIFADNFGKDDTDYLDGGAEALNIWRAKTAQPCNPCPACLKELEQMHELLNNIFGKVSKDDLPSPYVPAVLEPPYTLDKLLDNLAIPACHFHDFEIVDNEDNCERARIKFAKLLEQLSRINPDNQYKSIAICHVIAEREEFTDGGWDQDSHGNYYDVDYRADYEIDYPWTKPYFLWFDTLKDQVEQNNCILPEALKCDWENNLEKDKECLQEEWNTIRKDIDYLSPDDEKPSQQELLEFFIEREKSLKEFLLERCGCLRIPEESNERFYGFKYSLDKCADMIKLFIYGVPSANAPLGEIGDYIEDNAFALRKYESPAPLRDGIRKDNFAIKEYLEPLKKRMIDEMQRIAGDDTMPVYLRAPLLERINVLLQKGSKWGSHESEDILDDFRKQHPLTNTDGSFSECYQKIMGMRDVEANERRLKEAEAAASARRRVLFEMSHSIKNLTASVTEPLEMMLGELSGHHRRTVENALAGAGLIRDLAVGVHMSMRGETGAWRRDVKEPGFGAATLDKILLDALRHAVSNMFDGKYFNLFVRNYFGRDLEKFMQAQAEWKAAASAKEIFDCINKYFFDFTLDHGDTELNIPVGDRDGTASKLLIFFQELLLNAAKYSSFTEREKRFVKINISADEQQWDITIFNSSGNRQNAKSSGIGLEVIKNFVALFEAEYQAGFENDSYVSKIKFFLNK